MKKKLLTLLCVLLLLIGTVPSATALEQEAQRSADTLAALGLVRGYGTDYALQVPATRAHAAVLLVRLAGAERTAENAQLSNPFQDVPSWAQASVSYAAKQGWITGVTPTHFYPNTSISANAWCTMLLRMVGYSDRASDFSVSDAAAFARRIGLVAQSYEGTMTRGDLFETMYDALFFFDQDSDTTVIQRLIQRGVCSQTIANALGLLEPRLTARQIADRHMAAVFCLDTFEDNNSQTSLGHATGFFISPDGLAVTNYHSIAGARSAIATTASKEIFPVEQVIYYDAEIDIAVIRVSNTYLSQKTSFACLELAGTEDIRTGDIVYAISNPLGLGLAISSGLISSTAHRVDRYSLPCLVTSANISQGSSGGALMNEFGRVIAVTSGAYTDGNNMNLAVPIDPVLDADLSASGMTLNEVADIEARNA